MEQKRLTLLSQYRLWNMLCLDRIAQQSRRFCMHSLISSGSLDRDVAQVLETSPQILLVSLNLPYHSFTLIPALHAADCHPAIIISCVHHAMPPPRDVQRLGIAGIVSTLAHPADLVAEVEAVADRLPAPLMQQYLRAARWFNQASHNSVSLTEREQTIIALAAHGATDQEIAEGLKLSVRTVNNDFTRLYSRLNVSGRVEAVAYCIAKGLIRYE